MRTLKATRGRLLFTIVSGFAVALLGGLIGLGGAEFRLPILVALFGYAIRRAVVLNLLVSFVTVVAASAARLTLSRAPSFPDDAVAVVASMIGGGMVGAYLGSAWVARLPDVGLRRLVRGLLFLIGTLLLIESGFSWETRGLPLGLAGRVAFGLVAGSLIGVASTLLGVAGGELIIPTLVFAFGVGVKAAGTLSLLISVPTLAIGLWRHHAHGIGGPRADVTAMVLPMAGGSVAGAAAGAALVAYVPGPALKALLGVILVASGLKLFEAKPAARDDG